MTRTLALALARPLPDPVALLRGAIVVGCALTLIAAGQPLPSLGL